MTQCSCCYQDNSGANGLSHTNGFITLNGVPYLLGEYIDKETFQQIDESVVQSSIIVDQSSAMRAIIDISIDDIGRDASDGKLKVIGNSTLADNVRSLIADNVRKMNMKLPVLRKGIVIRVYYQLENEKTGVVLRTTVEEMRISNRNLFLLINSNDINNNALISNFSDSLVSTINEFTSGNCPMILRVTSIQLGYECVKVNPVIPDVTGSIVGWPVELMNSLEYPDPYALRPTYGMSETDMYQYHRKMQTQHIIGNPYTAGPENYIIPDTWYGFSRFYHFDDGGRTIILHNDEINDVATKTLLYQCGTIKVNRAFIINPGHRIIWKFNIWKNDLTVIPDTTSICQIMQAPIGTCVAPVQYDSTQGTDKCPCCKQNTSDSNTDSDRIKYVYVPQMNPWAPPPPPPPVNPNTPSPVDYTQNAAFNQMITAVVDLQRKIAELKGEEFTEPEITLLPTGPTVPETPTSNANCNCDPNLATTIANLSTMISALQEQVTSLEIRQDADDAEPDVVPITHPEIEQAVSDASSNTDNISGDEP